MTKKVTISLPDDVARRLQGLPNVSAYVTEALRRRIAEEESRRPAAEDGFEFTADGLVEAARELAAARAGMTEMLQRKIVAISVDSSHANGVPH